MFIQTEATPNPATLKFLPGRPVMDGGTFEARDLDEAEHSPLAKALLQLPGVSGVFFAPDFISVTKNAGEWQHLRPAILGVVTEFYLSGAPLIEGKSEAAEGSGEFFEEGDADSSRRSRTSSRRACVRRSPATAATSPSRAFATGSCISR